MGRSWNTAADVVSCLGQYFWKVSVTNPTDAFEGGNVKKHSDKFLPRVPSSTGSQGRKKGVFERDYRTL